MMMPIIRSGGQNVSIYDNTVVSLPPNLLGDHCNASSDSLCGYWYNDGWSDSNLNSYPDPEDWAPHNNHSQTYVSCIFR